MVSAMTATIPTSPDQLFAHLEGLCHTYLEPSVDVALAVDVTVNAKMRRPGVCGATETLLVHKDAVATHLRPVVDALLARGCEIRGDEQWCAVRTCGLSEVGSALDQKSAIAVGGSLMQAAQ